MKKNLNISIFVALAVILVVLSYYLLLDDSALRPGSVAPSSDLSPRIADLGLSVTGINSNDVQGDLQINIRADRMSFTKTKTLGFDNALMKKIAAKNFHLRITKSGRQIFYARKDRLTLPLDLQTITIPQPQILFPKDLDHPDEIRLDKKNKRLYIRRGKETVVWDLNQENSYCN